MKFTNPISNIGAADPFMTYDGKTGYYYIMFTLDKEIKIYRSRHAANVISDNDFVTVYEANEKDGIYGHIWAPEMHKGGNGKWYIYTSATTESPDKDGYKHLFILESNTENPFDGFNFKCFPSKDVFSIDPTVATLPNGKRYMACSRVIIGDPSKQVVEICELKDDTIRVGEYGIILEADYDWEKVPPTDDRFSINEGPFFVIRNNRVFLFYSANGCWQNEYCLGVAELIGDNPCDKRSWKKDTLPFLKSGNGVYGPGHASFFNSPDGKEVWCCYHTLSHKGDNNPQTRLANIIKTEFDENGYPIATVTTSVDTLHDAPSGETE